LTGTRSSDISLESGPEAIVARGMGGDLKVDRGLLLAFALSGELPRA
jgi:hypothetical protein